MTKLNAAKQALVMLAMQFNHLLGKFAKESFNSGFAYVATCANCGKKFRITDDDTNDKATDWNLDSLAMAKTWCSYSQVGSFTLPSGYVVKAEIYDNLAVCPRKQLENPARYYFGLSLYCADKINSHCLAYYDSANYLENALSFAHAKACVAEVIKNLLSANDEQKFIALPLYFPNIPACDHKGLSFDQALVLTGNDTLYHRKNRNANGSPQRWRVNGRVRTWKTQPTRIEIPIKHGMYSYDTLTTDTLNLVCLTEQEALANPLK